MRLYQAALAMAASMPLALLIMLAIPVGISRALQSAVSFLLFSSVVAVPFFFSGVAVCIALTRMSLPRGRVYFVDLAGAGLGCLGAVGLLSIFDAQVQYSRSRPSCFFAREPLPSTLNDPIYERTARSRRHRFWSWHVSTRQRCMEFSLFGRSAIDTRSHIFAEVWNSISRVRIYDSRPGEPLLWGPSLHVPAFQVDAMSLDIDNDASTQMLHFNGDLSTLQFLRLTSLRSEPRITSRRHGGDHRCRRRPRRPQLRRKRLHAHRRHRGKQRDCEADVPAAGFVLRILKNSRLCVV